MTPGHDGGEEVVFAGERGDLPVVGHRRWQRRRVLLVLLAGLHLGRDAAGLKLELDASIRIRLLLPCRWLHLGLGAAIRIRLLHQCRWEARGLHLTKID